MAEPTKRPAPKRTKKKRSAKKIVGRIFVVLVGALLTVMLSGAAYTTYAYQNLEVPDPNAEFTTNTSYVYYNDGKKLLGEVEVQNRQSVTYAEMSDNIKNAVVAAENKTFWTDPGYSIPGMIRAGLRILGGGSLQSGSTITQQYIKIMYLSQEQTLTRKFREILLARKLSQQMSKQEILTGYLNAIYFGRGAYGVQAASEAYFDKDASELTVPEAAVLSAVLNSPGYFDPAANGGDPQPLLDRYRYVLRSMREVGFITPADETEYAAELPKLHEVEASDKYGGSEGFLMKAVEAEIGRLPIDQAEVRGGGYQIITTFDKKAQKAAEKAAKQNTKLAAETAGKKASKLHAAIASVDVNTGGVIAMYGGPDYVQNSRNWATTPRATASTFKPFALAAGLENGFSLYSTMNGNTFTPSGDGVPIRNEFSNQYGPVTLLRATAESINTAFVDLTMKLPGDGPQKVIDIAQKLGAVKEKDAQDWDKTNRVAIGSAQVSPLNMASAYASFANNGVSVQNHVIAEIKDSRGKTVYKAEPEEERAISSDVAADVTHALQGVVKDGTGTAAQQLGRPVAGKTGTQGVDDKITSAWFTGYTRQVATSVMYVAGDGGNLDLEDYKRPWDPTFFGSSYPLMTWVDYMQTATEGQKVRDFPDPAFVNRGEYPPPVYTPPNNGNGNGNNNNNGNGNGNGNGDRDRPSDDQNNDDQNNDDQNNDDQNNDDENNDDGNNGDENNNPGDGNDDGGDSDGGDNDGGNTDGGNTDGGDTDGGNTDDGNTDGGNTDGGNTDGGGSGGDGSGDDDAGSGGDSGGDTGDNDGSGRDSGGGSDSGSN